jgi:nucleoside-diphosphate-sugar epimerase
VRVLIIGCGYVGLPLGAELARLGHEVFGLRRSPDTGELSAAGIQPLAGDITESATLARLKPDFDWVVNTVSSSKGGVDDYRAVYLEGTKRLIDWLQRNDRLRQYLYTSSTSVYAQTDGSWVTEDSATEPNSETGQVLVETEHFLRNAARTKNFPGTILRVAGIYGPERGHLFQQYLRGEARLNEKGSRFINMIHRDDVVRAIVAVLERGTAGEIYNVADDEPVTQREFFQWLSDQLGMPMPPVATEPEIANRKRGLTNKKVSNRKLRLALGCELKYPTFRQGYAAEIARLRSAGQWPMEGGHR